MSPYLLTGEQSGADSSFDHENDSNADEDDVGNETNTTKSSVGHAASPPASASSGPTHNTSASRTSTSGSSLTSQSGNTQISAHPTSYPLSNHGLTSTHTPNLSEWYVCQSTAGMPTPPSTEHSPLGHHTMGHHPMGVGHHIPTLHHAAVAQY